MQVLIILVHVYLIFCSEDLIMLISSLFSPPNLTLKKPVVLISFIFIGLLEWSSHLSHWDWNQCLLLILGKNIDTFLSVKIAINFVLKYRKIAINNFEKSDCTSIYITLIVVLLICIKGSLNFCFFVCALSI